MVLRRIGANQIERAVLEPDRLTRNLKTGRWMAGRDTSAGNFIRVIYVESSSGLQIVTTVITAIRITP
jgi:hypothetical protein